MRFLLVLFFLILLSFPVAAADAPLTVTQTLSGDELTLSDGRILHLTAIKGPSDSTPVLVSQARDYLAALTLKRSLVLEDAVIDRYGRTSAIANIADGKGQISNLQTGMLKAGLVFVYPPIGTEPQLKEMFQAEAEARKAKRGLWAESTYADLPPDKTEEHYGEFAFVSGKVLKAERVKNMVYLNFGDDWRKDFTIAIAAHDLHFFHKADLDPLDYEGKTLRVRGWIKRDYGPMIAVTHPAQIEVLQ